MVVLFLVGASLCCNRLRNKGRNLFQTPNVIADAGLHRWGYAQRLVNAPKVVEHEMQRYCVSKVLDLLAKTIGQAGKAAHAHAHGQVLALDVAGR